MSYCKRDKRWRLARTSRQIPNEYRGSYADIVVQSCGRLRCDGDIIGFAEPAGQR